MWTDTFRKSSKFNLSLAFFAKHAWLRFLVPVSTVSARNAWHNDPQFMTQKRQKRQGVLPEKLGGDVRHASWNPYPISDQNLWFFPTLFQTRSPGARRVTSCYGTYTVVGVNIKREMVLSPDDEEVANSSKKHTQLKARVHKPYPVSDQNGRNWYPISNQNGWKTIPFGASHTHIAYIRDNPPTPGEKCIADYESRICLFFWEERLTCFSQWTQRGDKEFYKLPRYFISYTVKTLKLTETSNLGTLVGEEGTFGELCVPLKNPGYPPKTTFLLRWRIHLRVFFLTFLCRVKSKDCEIAQRLTLIRFFSKETRPWFQVSMRRRF